VPATNTPLRYPGGKSRLYHFLVELLECNGLTNCVYVEPFAGGAGLALSLLLRGNVREIVINDLDYSIYAFWYCVLNEPEQLIRDIEDVPLTTDEWNRQREIQRNPRSYSINEVALSTLYLNRTNRSGIIKGGVIGGKAQSGTYKLSCRFNKDTSIGKIRRIAALRDKIRLYNMCVKDFIPEVVSTLGSETLVYLDPPYIAKGNHLYCNYFVEKDHRDLGALARDLQVPWILTYDVQPIVYEIYDGFRISEVSLTYTAGSKRVGKELMVYAPRLLPPDTDKGIIAL